MALFAVIIYSRTDRLKCSDSRRSSLLHYGLPRRVQYALSRLGYKLVSGIAQQIQIAYTIVWTECTEMCDFFFSYCQRHSTGTEAHLHSMNEEKQNSYWTELLSFNWWLVWKQHHAVCISDMLLPLSTALCYTPRRGTLELCEFCQGAILLSCAQKENKAMSSDKRGYGGKKTQFYSLKKRKKQPLK